MVFELCSHKADPDPQVQALVRKITLLLRIMAKYPTAATQAKSLLCIYSSQRKKGAAITIGPASPWDHRPDFGPIAHLTTALSEVGTHIDNEFNIHQP